MVSSIDTNFSNNKINAQKPSLVYNYELDSLNKIKQISKINNYTQDATLL